MKVFTLGGRYSYKSFFPAARRQWEIQQGLLPKHQEGFFKEIPGTNIL